MPDMAKNSFLDFEKIGLEEDTNDREFNEEIEQFSKGLSFKVYHQEPEGQFHLES